MSVTNSPTKKDVAIDQLIDKLQKAIAAVEALRIEKVNVPERVKMRLAEQVKSLEHDNLVLKNEVESLRTAVEDERAERRHYHSLASRRDHHAVECGRPNHRRCGQAGWTRTAVKANPVAQGMYGRTWLSSRLDRSTPKFPAFASIRPP